MRVATAVAIAAFLCATGASGAEPTAATTAFLVSSRDPEAVALGVSAALKGSDALTRSTAARVALARNVRDALPALRDALNAEKDVSVTRELLRALVLIGDPADIDLALRVASASAWPALAEVGRMVARRDDAIELYFSKLRPAGFAADSEFFTLALWQRSVLAVGAGSRLIGSNDEKAWNALLRTLRKSNLVLPNSLLGVSLTVPSEDIRTTTAWFLVHSFAQDPARIDEFVRSQLSIAPTDASDREGFARELLNRMTGKEARKDDRWLRWLQTFEADELIGSEIALFQYFTEEEFLMRKRHCDLTVSTCGARNFVRGAAPPKPVAPPAFMFPGALPAGLGDHVLKATRCGSRYLGVAGAATDRAGRIEQLEIQRVMMPDECTRALATLSTLSIIAPESIATSPITSNVVLVHESGTPLCVDEDPPEVLQRQPSRIGGAVTAPVVISRVEPMFPEGARRKLRGSVAVIAEAVITRAGCVRSVRLAGQSTFGELNTAAILALSQWKFSPGRMNGEPVDVVFHLTITFKVR